MRTVIFCGAVLALAACSTTPPEPLGPKVATAVVQPLTAAEIRSVAVGSTGTGTITGSTSTFAVYLAPDGTAQARRPTGLESGRWRLTDDGQLCMQWQNYRAGEEYCQRAYREGTMLRLQDTKSADILAFTPGNQLATPR